MAVTVTQYPGFGCYPEQQGLLNAIDVTRKNSTYARGGDFAVNSLMYPLSGGTEMTYSAWCAQLAAANCNMIRVIWCGRNTPSGAVSYGVEPPPYGTFNVWHSALDALHDSDLATFRSDQVYGSPGGANFATAKWTGSNIKALLDACEANSIKVLLFLSSAREFGGSTWAYHAYNYGNRYLNGVTCEAQDRGFLDDAWEIYTDAAAATAMKARFSFIIDLIEDYSCISMWGLMAEQIWTMVPAFWGEVVWEPNMGSNIDDITSWNDDMARYIRNQDYYKRPIVSSIVRAPPDFTWPASSDHQANKMVEPLVIYPIDRVEVNCYHGDKEKFAQNIHAVREKVHPKRIIIGQYYPDPWVLGPTAPIRTEYSPYLESKVVEWMAASLTWGSGAGRWPNLIELTHNHWTKGGPADPDVCTIGGGTQNGLALIDWKDWTGAQDWQDDVSSTGLDWIVCTGDGDHFVGLLYWTSSGSKTVTISSVTDGAWTFKEWDWATDSLIQTHTPTAASNSVSVTVAAGTMNITWIYGSKD